MKEKHLYYFTIAFLISLLSFMVYQINHNKKIDPQLTKIKKQTEQLRSFVKVDKICKDNIDKVISVINRYNPFMSEKLKSNIASEINDVSMKYDNLDVDLICATITHESAFTWSPKVVSPKGAMGLMQIMPSTGKFLAKIAEIDWSRPENVLFDPVLNIRLGSRYLSSLIEMYKVDGGLAAYNGGGKIVNVWLAKNKAPGILYAETQKYVPAVLSLYEEFRTD